MSEATKNIERVEVTPRSISPSSLNPRKHFDPEGLKELAGSIREHGVLQDVGARRRGEGSYELIWGERRWRASMMISNGDDGLPAEEIEMPVKVVDMTDQEVFDLQVIENLQRESLTVVEEARAYETALGFGRTQDQVAETFKRPKSRVSEMLRLLDFPNKVLQRIDLPASDPDHLPVYKAVEAARVPADAEGGQLRLRALAAVEECSTVKVAREVVSNRFLRPIREKEEWNARDLSGVVEDVYETEVEFTVLDYEECRALFPPNAEALTPITARGYVMADDVPPREILSESADDTKTWGDWAAVYGVPISIACNGRMEPVRLVLEESVRQSALVTHQFVCRQEGTKIACEGGYEVADAARMVFWSAASGDLLPSGIRKLEGVNPVQVSLREGVVYRVSAGGTIRDAEDAVIELRPPESGVDVPPFYGLDLGRCSFVPEFSKGPAVVSSAKVDSPDPGDESPPDREEEDLEKRAALVSDMLSDLEAAVREKCNVGAGNDEFLARCGADLVELAIAGFSGNDNPYIHILLALDKPESEADHRIMDGWEGFKSSRAGYESATVCAWVLYWLNLHEDPDLESCGAWKQALAIYG